MIDLDSSWIGKEKFQFISGDFYFALEINSIEILILGYIIVKLAQSGTNRRL